MMNEKELARHKPLIKLVDLGALHVMEEGIAPSKGCGCTPPAQAEIPAS